MTDWSEDSARAGSRALRYLIGAAAVHVFTASGIVCALLATRAVLESAWEQAFFWLGLALIVDGLDGTLARLLDVEGRLPRFSGERLDQVIDYVTYVFVPVLALQQAGFLKGIGGVVLGSLILLSSLFHFSDIGNKAEDHSFVGFPAVWNIVTFYLFAFAASAFVTAIVVLACVALTFVPMRWVHPLRVVSLRPVTMVLTVLWALAASWVIWHGFPAGPVPKLVLGAIGLYVAGLALLQPWSGGAAGKSP